MSRFASLAISILVCLASSSAIARDTPKRQSSPLEVVYKLYKDYAWQALGLESGDKEGLLGKNIAYESKEVLEKYFDVELSSLLVRDANSKERANGEVGRLEFDPIFASQDPAAYDMKVRLLASGNIRVTFTYPSNRAKIEMEYKVTRGTKGWRISDIIYLSNGCASLKKILSP